MARRSAVKARTQAANQIRDLIVSAPEGLRDKLGHLSTEHRVAACAWMRSGAISVPVAGDQAITAAACTPTSGAERGDRRLDETIVAVSQGQSGLALGYRSRS